jgi:hypothetical protein
MEKSLKSFMDGIIDYAGLFPPADLPLDAAIQNYAQYHGQQDAWMLSRFIIPAARLEALAPYAEALFSSESPIPFTVLGKGTGTLDEFSTEIEHTIRHCENFNAIHAGKVKTDMLEIKLPKEAAFSHDVDLLKELMEQTAKNLGSISETPSVIFYEVLLDESWKKDTEAVLEAIASHNGALHTDNENYRYAAFKIRCGGVEAHHFPSVEQLAYILNKAREHKVALKGTAGLHHPVRHYAEQVQTKMHGFFNVFGGAMLAWANDLNDEELEHILAEEDADQFAFKDEAFSWKGYSVSSGEIEELREAALLSFGSCSFMEPIDDLKKLKLY